MEMTMNEPSIKQPTKKAFHFPKGATATTETDVKEAGAPVEATVKAESVAAPKVSRRKSSAKVEAAQKAAGKSKTETAPKVEVVAKGKAEAAAKQKAAPKAKATPKQKAAPKTKSAPKEKATEAGVVAAPAEKPQRAK